MLTLEEMDFFDRMVDDYSMKEAVEKLILLKTKCDSLEQVRSLHTDVEYLLKTYDDLAET